MYDERLGEISMNEVLHVRIGTKVNRHVINTNPPKATPTQTARIQSESTSSKARPNSRKITRIPQLRTRTLPRLNVREPQKVRIGRAQAEAPDSKGDRLCCAEEFTADLECGAHDPYGVDEGEGEGC